MRRRLFAVVSAISLLLWFATAGLWVLSYHMKPGSVSSLTPDGYMLGRGVRFLPDGGEISLYNQPLPYHGSTISFSPNWPKTISFTGAGIYFRHMTWPAEFPGTPSGSTPGLHRGQLRTFDRKLKMAVWDELSLELTYDVRS